MSPARITRGYQHRRNCGLIAHITQLFARDIECVTREGDRFARIISESAGEAINRRVVASN